MIICFFRDRSFQHDLRLSFKPFLVLVHIPPGTPAFLHQERTLVPILLVLHDIFFLVLVVRRRIRLYVIVPDQKLPEEPLVLRKEKESVLVILLM